MVEGTWGGSSVRIGKGGRRNENVAGDHNVSWRRVSERWKEMEEEGEFC